MSNFARKRPFLHFFMSSSGPRKTKNVRFLPQHRSGPPQVHPRTMSKSFLDHFRSFLTILRPNFMLFCGKTLSFFQFFGSKSELFGPQRAIFRPFLSQTQVGTPQVHPKAVVSMEKFNFEAKFHVFLGKNALVFRILWFKI